jgi:hypothetical protein
VKNCFRIVALVPALVLAFALTPVSGMAMNAPAPGDCPAHAQERQHGHAAQDDGHAAHDDGHAAHDNGHAAHDNGHPVDDECARSCLLACALAGLTAALSAPSVLPPAPQERFLLPGAGPRQAIEGRFDLFRPPRPLIA